MTTEQLTEALRKKMKKEGRTLIWFVKTYLPDIKYTTFSSQFNGFNSIQPEIIKAIKKFLEE